MENYLGALGHSVILKEGSLVFIHAHPKESQNENDSLQGIDHSPENHQMNGMPANKGQKIDFSTYIPEAGVYKIITEFQHLGKILTTDYVVKVD